jgi:hypothetical protein
MKSIKIDNYGLIIEYNISSSTELLSGFIDIGTQEVNVKNICIFNNGKVIDTGISKVPPNVNHTFDSETLRWIDLRDLEELKTSKWEEIKVSRSNSELGGFKFDGKVFNSTLSDQIKINGLLNTIAINQTHTEKWYAQDNSYIVLAKENIALFSSKLSEHISYVYKVAGDLRAMINNCNSKKELDQIIWPL